MTAAAQRRLRHETLSAERRTLIRLPDQGEIGDEVLHRLEHELDVEAIRIGLGERLPAENDPVGGAQREPARPS